MLSQEEWRRVEENLGLAWSLALKFKPKCHRDLWFDAALDGLIRAAQKFSVDRGIKFSTFAGRVIWFSLVSKKRWVDHPKRRYSANALENRVKLEEVS